MAIAAENDGADGAGDDDKKMMRQRELLKHGTTFVQDEWCRKFEYKGKKDKGYNGTYKGYEASKLNKNLELVFEGPSRQLITQDNIYLGNMKMFYMDDQPYIFCAYYEDYNVARAKYGKFENWKYVKPGAFKSDLKMQTSSASIYNNNWRLNTLQDNEVEIIIYQDQPNDEFQIMINGVPMLPLGFALCNVAPGGKYNIIKQVLKPIRKDFALGKAFVQFGSVRYLSELLDEMLKLLTFKERKSVAPSYINNSGRYISPNVLRPGRISMNIPAGALSPVGQEGQGITAGDFNMLTELSDKIDKNTISPVFQGQLGKSGTTATEVLEVQKQAKLTLGLIVAAAVLLEKKLAYLRIFILLENWFEPVSVIKEINEMREEVEKKEYRTGSREATIGGAGKGIKMLRVADQPHPKSREIRMEEDRFEKSYGTPLRISYIDPERMMDIKRRWFVVITPKEKESSSYYKLLFREYLGDIIAMTQFGIQPDVEDIQKEFARVWQKSPTSTFKKEQLPAGQVDTQEMIKGISNAGGTPKVPFE